MKATHPDRTFTGPLYFGGAIVRFADGQADLADDTRPSILRGLRGRGVTVEATTTAAVDVAAAGPVDVADYPVVEIEAPAAVVVTSPPAAQDDAAAEEDQVVAIDRGGFPGTTGFEFAPQSD